jgi:hypothetical protein
MKNKIILCDVPSKSQLSNQLNDAYFYDSHQFSTRFTDRKALEIWLAHANSAPAWINALMTIRNKTVSLLGLKDLGQLADKANEKSADAYQVGDRVGIFTILFISDNEVVLGDSDKHLDVKLSVYKTSNNSDNVTISTVVHVHNLLGKVYMLFVEPMHKLIVPATIKRAEF